MRGGAHGATTAAVVAAVASRLGCGIVRDAELSACSDTLAPSYWYGLLVLTGARQALPYTTMRGAELLAMRGNAYGATTASGGYCTLETRLWLRMGHGTVCMVTRTVVSA